MAQEFIINSQAIEDKINQLLPSQGGYAAGVDFSASTQIIPIVDLTESAEGSILRQDLQTSLSLTSVTAFSVSNTTSTLVNTTGYYRVFGNVHGVALSGVNRNVIFQITDGTTTKILVKYNLIANSGIAFEESFDFLIKLEAGDSLQCVSNNANIAADGCTRQIADLSGNLVNP